jgi:hypothetical protein
MAGGAALVIVLGIVVFAVQGGEYGTRDVVRQRTRRERLASRARSSGW